MFGFMCSFVFHVLSCRVICISTTEAKSLNVISNFRRVLPLEFLKSCSPLAWLDDVTRSKMSQLRLEISARDGCCFDSGCSQELFSASLLAEKKFLSIKV